LRYCELIAYEVWNGFLRKSADGAWAGVPGSPPVAGSFRREYAGHQKHSRKFRFKTLFGPQNYEFLA